LSYHVQVSRSFQRAALFNLSEAELIGRIVEPWSRGARVELGDREWDPAEADLVVLEGPELDSPELALGQGWGNASRGGRDVTAELLNRSRSVAVVAGPTGHAAVAAPLAGLRVVDWETVRERILASADPGVAYAVVVLDDEIDRFEAGLAVGALGDRALLVRDDSDLAALAARLRA
jgi:hypothetical protein